MQSLHPDFETTLPDTDYFFIGSGKISAALQWSRAEGVTPGLLVWQPDHFPRKWGTHLFHPEFGLERAIISVIVNGIKYRPERLHARAQWRFENGIPQIVSAWRAGNVLVQEEYSTLGDLPVIMRNVRLFSDEAVSAKIECALYANPNLFDSFSSTEYGLEASGYSTIRILSSSKAIPNERYLSIDLGEGKELQTQLLIEIGERERKGYSVEKLIKETSHEHEYWSRASDINTDNEELAPLTRLFQVASAALRSVISQDGKFDSSIWQYGMEWGRDASHVAIALVYSGQFELARAVIEHIINDLINDEGMVAEASRFRGGEQAELDSNGAVLYALGIYCEWTDDIELIRKYWEKISRCANYLLRDEFYDPNVGLLRSTRDIWERGAEAGLKQGYDVAHQVYGYLGLSVASKLAVALEDPFSASSWLLASVKMTAQFGIHDKYNFIDDGHIIKRRLSDGSVQKELEINADNEFASSFIPEGMPLASGGKHLLEPDVTQLLPIIYHMLNPEHENAGKTIDICERLWSQAWGGGGYGRYDVSGEPDSPGPWPLSTIIMAAAYFERGELAKAMNALGWLVEKAGEGGAWFEFYGERPTPPLPPVGILPWAWAQYITLFVRHILNPTVEKETLIIKSRLQGLRGTLRFLDKRVAFST